MPHSKKADLAALEKKYDTTALINEVNALKFKKWHLDAFISDLSEEKKINSWTALNKIMGNIDKEAAQLFLPQPNNMIFYYLRKPAHTQDLPQSRAKSLQKILQMEAAKLNDEILRREIVILKMNQNYRIELMRINASSSEENTSRVRARSSENKSEERKKDRQTTFTAAAQSMFTIKEESLSGIFKTLVEEKKPKKHSKK